jgi:hypothetical protein
VALVLAGVGVEHDDPSVAVSVRDVGFVGGGIDEDLRRLSEVHGVVTSAALAEMTDLQQEFSALCELQDVGVLSAVGANPDVAFVIDRDPVVRLRPFVSLTGTAPVPDHVARLIEFQDRRRREAALGARRFQRRRNFILGQRGLPVNDPDVILGIHRHADG